MLVRLFLFALIGATTRSPTTAPSDSSTPRGALRMFTIALDAGDHDGILALLDAQTDQEKKLANATADLAAASAELKNAAVQKFGAEKSQALGADEAGVTQS